MKFRSGIENKNFHALILILALGSLLCRGAKPYQPVSGDPMLEPWRWRTFPELSGLGAQCMTEGTDGKIWFGTVAGIWNYDGIAWVHYSPEQIANDNDVVSLNLAADGTLYAGARGGISQFRSGTWTRLFYAGGHRFGDIRKLAIAPDGALWAATSWGALRFQNSKWNLFTSREIAGRVATNQTGAAVTVELLPESVVAKDRTNSPSSRRYDLSEVCVDSEGRIWFGTDGGEILRYTPGSQTPLSGGSRDGKGNWTIYNETDGMVGGRTPSILALQSGAVWVVYGTSSGYLNVFDGAAWKASRLADAGAPEDCGDMIQTRDGVVWLSGRYVLCALRDGHWRNYEKPAVPIPSAHNFIMQSADGALWIAGPGTEIQRVDYQTSRWLTYQDLSFQWASPAGAQWFLHRDGRVVVQETNRWTSYGGEDGLIDAPVALLGTRSGEIWAAGSHAHTAATARFDGQKWTRCIHDDLSWGVDWRAALESADGSVWFGAAVDSSNPKRQIAGLMQFHHGTWTHHHQPGQPPQNSGAEDLAALLPATQRPEPVGKFFCLGESRDGNIWAGRNLLVLHDGHKWSVFSPPPDIHFGVIETIFSSRERDLWIGTRQFGAVRYDGNHWQQFQGKDSLVANTVRSLVETSDGSIWAATDRGFSRFDGHTWSADALPAQLNIPNEGGSLKASTPGALWINRFALEWNRRAWPKAPRLDTAICEFWTVCHQFKGAPPQTTITEKSEKVSQPGNLSISWSGAAPWRESKESRLQFSFRLDDQPWSAFDTEQSRSFFSLPSGRHHFEVRARDQDFNVDPSPATMDFVVLPPVWRQGWFILLMILLAGLIATQSLRVFLKQARLRQTNRMLADEIEERERAEAALGRLNLELDQRVKARTAELEIANKELESFSYSVSHDLRAPLRSIDGFSRALLEDYSDKLDAEGREHLQTVRTASQRMGHLIDDMLRLSQINRSEMRWTEVDLSQLAGQVAGELKKSAPDRNVEFIIAPNCAVCGDAGLLRIVLENGLGNAWKYTNKKSSAKIEFGPTESAQGPAYFIRDNGCGFDMKYAHKLFGAFQRLHSTNQFPGTGIGLASVQRVIHRHGGQVWIEGKLDQGTTLYFTLPKHPLTP
jgi:signal transduction histidine kinase/ligand-binding sensor domain-containing protein